MKELTDGVHQLREIPPNAINIYLVEGPEGDVLIDAGSRHDARRIRKQTAQHKLSLVALTHAHGDHQGAAKETCERTGAPLACHSADVAAMEGREPFALGNPDHPLARLSRWALSGPPHPVSRVLADGDEVGGFRVIHTPGHSPGHVTFWRESDRVAIAGDVLFGMHPLTTVPGLHEPPSFFTPDPSLNRESIRRLAALEPELLCLGHGPPVRDAARKIAKFAQKLS